MAETKAKTTLIFVPLPVLSHLLASIKLANLLTDRDHRLSITILILNLQLDPKISSHLKNSPNSRVHFVHLERDESDKSPKSSLIQIVSSQKSAVKSAAAAASAGSNLAGFIFDILCSSMMDVAAELAAPSYIFFTCGAAGLGLLFRLSDLIRRRDRALKDYLDSDAAIPAPTFVNPVPAKVWPAMAFANEAGFLDLTDRLRSVSGIVVNTFLELEAHAVAALAGDAAAPAVYPVGPLLQDEAEPADEAARRRRAEVLGWLGEQPESSVAFLCFGTNGHFGAAQVAEIAAALERSGTRFLWSLRKPPSKETGAGIGEYADPGTVLPDGFLDRTAGAGRVIGWAPQMAVLSHRAVGGFVTHCGWNSILESVSCGVPMAVWPMYAEQQMNAFQLVRELEIAVEIKMDYRKDSPRLVAADRIEKGIRELMDLDNKIHANVKELKEKSKSALLENGSSSNFVRSFIENVTNL
ncbi:putative UDP-glucose flavonoid 3-O-glucosyltransferase 3 [Salvia hispanica]|uniref:putative UDP-glucose flavonoid 3-O-glucosyltransferase 3 n=1 Tax=Salvia hispanica TaxID=49212 RepID=UPI002009D896|nr:putative UDP-glucose flavonoid 3-O-glucosyltransferase 3 [Salvia hispanica]